MYYSKFGHLNNIKFVKYLWILECIKKNKLDIPIFLNFNEESEKKYLEEKWILRCIYPVSKNISFNLQKERYKIGANENFDICLKSNGYLSLSIATLIIHQSEWFLREDDDNENGIFIFYPNGYKRIKYSKLNFGDVICFEGGNNVKYYHTVKTLENKVYAFSLEKDSTINNIYNENETKILELQKPINVLKQQNYHLKSLLNCEKEKEE